jgi:antitoxin (DNA-binding transcriptional repressor) of toxin-antitoxin stability system
VREFTLAIYAGRVISKEKTGRAIGRHAFTRNLAAAILLWMSQTAITVADAAERFLAIVEEVERKCEPAVLTREGRPVVIISPYPRVARTCAELAGRWQLLERLPVDEADAFANDLELGRANLPPVHPAWD